MLVQVDTRDIAALERRIEELSVVLTATLSKRAKKQQHLTDADLRAVEGCSSSIDKDDTGIMLRFVKASKSDD